MQITITKKPIVIAIKNIFYQAMIYKSIYEHNCYDMLLVMTSSLMLVVFLTSF